MICKRNLVAISMIYGIMTSDMVPAAVCDWPKKYSCFGGLPVFSAGTMCRANGKKLSKRKGAGRKTDSDIQAEVQYETCTTKTER